MHPYPNLQPTFDRHENLDYNGSFLVRLRSGWKLGYRKTPNQGEPGSTHTNPGSGQVRRYGPDGLPEYDIDFDHDHGQGMPHAHNWQHGKRGPAVPVSPLPQRRPSGPGDMP